MERYHIYKLGIAILFYAVYCRRQMIVNGLDVDHVNNKNSTRDNSDDYYVYYQGVQGRPGKDFPVFSRIPRTSFNCKEVESGYYADLETNCQVFHICNEGTKVSFLCPNGTIFQQSDLICDWWFKVNCTNSPNLYEESAEHLRESYIRRKASRRVLNQDHITFKSGISDRKMDVHYEDGKRNGRRFKFHDGGSEEETQITEETGNFYKNNNKNQYPNHRTTYSDLQDTKHFYTNPPNSGGQTTRYNNNAINNGQPFVVSTPKLGSTKAPFRYSPTVPATTPKSNTRSFNSLVETFTNPPSIANGKSTVQRKPKQKTSYTVGLNSVQGNVPLKPSQNSNNNNKVFRITLASNGVAKPIKPKPQTIKFNLKSNEGVKPLGVSLENEIPSYSPTVRPTTGFYVTKGTTLEANFATPNFIAGSITGSKNTYIPTTQTPPTSSTTEYYSNTFGFVKPTGNPKPKPFSLASTTLAPSTDGQEQLAYPNYQVSSASPFTNVPPTLPTSYTTAQYINENYNYPKSVFGMLDTLKELANVRIAKEHDFDKSRPGLVVPPSVGPQTLHTLAVYFANALDSLVPGENASEPETTMMPIKEQQNENAVINSLLSRDTINKYHDLFKTIQDNDPHNDDDDADEEDDLDRDHSNNAVQSPRVRQLAKVFTQALSSYLDDPETFKRVLQEVRPTEPPPLNTLPTEPISNDEDELLNFSDADIKPENPRLPTPAPANPTWGYILALNNSANHNHLDNHVGDVENLQSADSQSFVPGFNDIHSNRVDKALKANNLPFNHWTSSPDVTKLWESTLYVNPLSVNQEFQTQPTISKEITDSGESVEYHEGFVEDEVTEGVVKEPIENFESNIQETEYNIRELPKIDLNATQVHGILIDFMNQSSAHDDSRLHNILRKLNTTQEEFLSKMKEIESNPLTRRLILLLVNECSGNNKTIDMKSSTVREIINLANNNQATHSANNNRTSGFSKLVDTQLKDDDQDSRALQLLNSLYSIASKYGRK